jgi:hypothetical protein
LGFGFVDFFSLDEKSIILVALSDRIISKRLIIGRLSVAEDHKPINKARYIKGNAINSFISIDFILKLPNMI